MLDCIGSIHGVIGHVKSRLELLRTRHLLHKHPISNPLIRERFNGVILHHLPWLPHPVIIAIQLRFMFGLELETEFL